MEVAEKEKEEKNAADLQKKCVIRFPTPHPLVFSSFSFLFGRMRTERGKKFLPKMCCFASHQHPRNYCRRHTNPKCFRRPPPRPSPHYRRPATSLIASKCCDNPHIKIFKPRTTVPTFTPFLFVFLPNTRGNFFSSLPVFLVS